MPTPPPQQFPGIGPLPTDIWPPWPFGHTQTEDPLKIGQATRAAGDIISAPIDAIKWLIAHIPQMLLIILGFAMFAMGALIISKGPRTAIQRAVPGIGSNTYTFKYEGRPNAETS